MANHSPHPIAHFRCPLADVSWGCAKRKFYLMPRVNGHLKKDHLKTGHIRADDLEEDHLMQDYLNDHYLAELLKEDHPVENVAVEEQVDPPCTKYYPITQDIYNAVIARMKEQKSETQESKWRSVCELVRSRLDLPQGSVPMYSPSLDDVSAFIWRMGNVDPDSWFEEETRIFEEALQNAQQAGQWPGELGLSNPECSRRAFRLVADALHIMQS